MHVFVCVCVYGKYQNPKVNREGILIYGCVCIIFEYTEIVYPQTHDLSVYGFLALAFAQYRSTVNKKG